MNRHIATPLLLALIFLAGCSWCEAKKEPLPGERISVLTLDRQLTPDPALAEIPITLPRPAVNQDWREPGGDPDHEMQHLALPDKLAQAWQGSVGEGAA